MGRTLKRVPLDFSWPLKQVWVGYFNPWNEHRIRCPECTGRGFNQATLQLYRDWENWQYQLTQEEVEQLARKDHLWEFTRVPRSEEEKQRIGTHPNGVLKENTGYIPTAAEVNAWAKSKRSYTATVQWFCVITRADRLGIYGQCPVCDGAGELWALESSRLLAEKWVRPEPPVGEGYQLWENTSEGSPCSPVFETLDLLCEWCEENATTPGGGKASREEWKQMLSGDRVYHRDSHGNVFI